MSFLFIDPLFDQVPAYIISNQYKRLTPMPPSVSSRRTIKESVLIIPAFSVSLSTISLASSAKSSSMLCICIQLKDEIRSSNFILDRVLVQMTHATVHVHENQQVKVNAKHTLSPLKCVCIDEAQYSTSSKSSRWL